MLWLRYSAHSKADIARIWDYISDDSPRNAVAVLDRIFEKCEKLRDQHAWDTGAMTFTAARAA
jgi:plasmid stabilization system protein ParE